MSKTSYNARMKLKEMFPIFGLIVFDQITKRIFVQSSWAGFFSFFPIVWNQGSARGLKVPVWMSVGLGVVMLYILQDSRFKMQHVPKILLIAGIVGNMIDRLLYDAVRDFLWVGDWFPVFNIADGFMCVGVGLLFWFEWNQGLQKK